MLLDFVDNEDNDVGEEEEEVDDDEMLRLELTIVELLPNGITLLDTLPAIFKFSSGLA